MTKEKIKEEIDESIIRLGGCEQAELKDDADLVTDLGFDSLDSVELIMEMETKFTINVSDDTAEGVHTYGDLRKLLENILISNE